MGYFLDIARIVLSEANHPLSAQEIIDLATHKGILRSEGRAPMEILKSKLSTNILKHKSNSLFMRVDKGKFALRAWEDKYEEYIADRFKKALLNEKIAVFPESSLTKYIKGRGLHLTPIENSQELISECRPMLRRLAEADDSIIQLISVFIVRLGEKYLTYKRTKRLPENRLHGYYSSIFGGHLNLTDILPLFNVFSSEYANLEPIRELKEEVRWQDGEEPQIKYKGLLYDDSKPVSRQHLGIVYDVFLKSSIYQIGERGFLMDSKFESLSEIEDRISDFENWSVLIVEHERREYNKTIKID